MDRFYFLVAHDQPNFSEISICKIKICHKNRKVAHIFSTLFFLGAYLFYLKKTINIIYLHISICSVDQIPEITRTFRSADVRFLDGGHDIGIAESRHEFLQQAGSFINEAK